MHFAVDVGTSSTAAAIGQAGDEETLARPVRLGRNGDTVSSAVFVTDDEILHGDAAERRGVGSPTRLVRGVKRRIGDPVPFTLAGRTLTAEELHARTVEWAIAHATADGVVVRDVSVTVPAAWGPHRRAGVRAALERRGIVVSAMPTEPEAAAVHYASTHAIAPGAVLAVYDLGAGTFDLAFVRIGDPDEPAAVLHSEGIADLGGADFDDAVVDHVLSSTDVDPDPGGAAVVLAAMRRECVAAKEALSFDSEALIPLLDGTGATVRIVRSEFEAMIEPDIDRTIAAFTRARERAGIPLAHIEAIVLSGGSSRIPRVAQLLSEAFDLPLRADADPKAVVALGAARLGADTARRRMLIPRDAVAPPPRETAQLAFAPRPPRWQAAMTGTAAAAVLVGGFAFGGSATALGGAAHEITAHGAVGSEAAAPATSSELLALQNPFLPLPVSDVAEGLDRVAPDPAAPDAPSAAVPPPGGTSPALRPPLRPGIAPTPPPRPRAVARLLTPTAPAEAPSASAPQNRPPSVRPPSGSAPSGPASGGPTTPSPSPSASVPDPGPADDPQPTHEPTPQPEPTPAEPGPTTDPQPEPQPEPTVEPQPEPQPEPTVEPQPEPQPGSEPDPSPQPDPKPEPSPSETPVLL